MGAVEVGLQILIGPRPGKLHHTGAEFESSRETVFASVERQEIQAKRLLSLLADSGGPLLNLIWSQVMTSQNAKGRPLANRRPRAQARWRSPCRRARSGARRPTGHRLSFGS